MMSLSGKKVLITGASSGIGKALATALALKGCELYLLARRKEKLEDLARELHPAKVHLIAADVNDPDLKTIITNASNSHLDILINNAGLALGKEKIEAGKFEDWEQMLNTNVLANFKMVHIVLPWMLQNGGGDIINICSIAGHYTYAGGAVYCASKHAVHAFTKVLREESIGKNLRVMQISPGMVDTEFSTVRFKGDKKLADSVYAGMTPLSGEDIARMMVFMLEQPRHVVIDEIITMPLAQGSPTTVYRS